MTEEEKVNPFYEATKTVFKSMLDLDISRIRQSEGPGKEEYIWVEVNLVGDLSGTVVYNFPKSTTLNIVKTISGMEMEQVDEFVTSMLGEMANIISGNAVTYLSEHNFKCDIQPPKITVGVPETETSGSTVDMYLNSPAGELREHVNLSNQL